MTKGGFVTIPVMALLAYVPLLFESAAAEGKKIIVGMLLVGLVIIAVIALGETTHWLRARRDGH